MKKTLILLSGFLFYACSTDTETIKTKAEQLAALKQKQIMVAMWGWEPEIMAPNAVKFGYEVVNQPQNSDTVQHAIDIPIWADAGLDMLVRPDLFDVKDPFDEEQVQAGLEKLKKVIMFHEENNPNVVAYVIQWGMFGEGGFEWGYEFSDKAKEAFNEHMNTPGMELPEPPAHGVPGSMRYIKWNEFRAQSLANWRERFVNFAKQYTKKLVGTWSEVYPVDNYVLNMGDAPGADFFYYDLSFGDVTCNQRIAFGECHGEMEAYPSFEEWLKHQLPLMAKAAGEGVTPIAFQFPMRKDHGVVDNLGGRKQYTVEKIEEEYSLHLGPYIRKLIDATKDQTYNPEVALVYHSFQASALPGGPINENWNIAGNHSAMPLYYSTSKQIESSLHMMGVNMKAIPYEWLDDKDLSKYKIVIVPDPMYLTEEMRANLSKANKVLYAGEYLLAHRDTTTQSGNFQDEFKAETILPDNKILYLKNNHGKIEVNADATLMRGVDFGESIYPSDQMFKFENSDGTEVLASVNDVPVIFTRGEKSIHLANHAFNHAWNMEEDWLEKGMFTFLKNLMHESDVEVPIVSGPQARANLSYQYGSYGITGSIAWNTTGEDIVIKTTDGPKVTIPKYGWIKIDY
ncbi:MAG: hypothetical protein ABFS32_07975 [Bacteroidota bacterium]